MCKTRELELEIADLGRNEEGEGGRWTEATVIRRLVPVD